MTGEGGELVDLARHEVALHQEAAQIRLQPLDSGPFEVFKRVFLYVRLVVLAPLIPKMFPMSYILSLTRQKELFR